MNERLDQSENETAERVHSVTYAPGSLGVTPRSISITTSNLSRVCGNTNPTTDRFTVTGSGRVGTDAQGSTTAVTSAATSASHVGSYALTQIL
jgi:hypothetical protein